MQVSNPGRSWIQQDIPVLLANNLTSLWQNWYLQEKDYLTLNPINMPSLYELVTNHFITLNYICKRHFPEAFDQHCMTFQLYFTEILRTGDKWLLPVMNTMLIELRLLAVATEKSSDVKNVGSLKMLLVKHLRKWYRMCEKSLKGDIKKWAILALVNEILKIHSKTTYLCENLIKAIESFEAPDTPFPKGQSITFSFFAGRRALLNNDYEYANEYLTYAFESCHRLSVKNKRLILIYLITVKMLCGFIPKTCILEKYNLTVFLELIRAVKKGDIQSFEAFMTKNMKFLIDAKILLLIEKLKSTAYRNLFKKVYLIMNNFHLGIEYFHSALQLQYENNIDINETECIINNLIYEGKIIGYISHRELVLSKEDPFPGLSIVD